MGNFDESLEYFTQACAIQPDNFAAHYNPVNVFDTLKRYQEALGAKVILEAPAALVTLLRTLNGSFTLIKNGDAPPAFDLHFSTG